MKKTIHKYFWVWNFEKEEKWLNKMSSMGLRLINVGFCTYKFEESKQNEYIVRMQYIKSRSLNQENQQYINFVEETGAKYIGKIGNWIYFDKKNDGNKFEIFSDLDSRIKSLKNLMALLGLVAASEILILISNLGLFLRDKINFSITSSILALLCFSSFLTSYAFIRIWLILKELEKKRKLHE